MRRDYCWALAARGVSPGGHTMQNAGGLCSPTHMVGPPPPPPPSHTHTHPPVHRNQGCTSEERNAHKPLVAVENQLVGPLPGNQALRSTAHQARETTSDCELLASVARPFPMHFYLSHRCALQPPSRAKVLSRHFPPCQPQRLNLAPLQLRPQRSALTCRDPGCGGRSARSHRRFPAAAGTLAGGGRGS